MQQPCGLDKRHAMRVVSNRCHNPSIFKPQIQDLWLDESPAWPWILQTGIGIVLLTVRHQKNSPCKQSIASINQLLSPSRQIWDHFWPQPISELHLPRLRETLAWHAQMNPNQPAKTDQPENDPSICQDIVGFVKRQIPRPNSRNHRT